MVTAMFESVVWPEKKMISRLVEPDWRALKFRVARVFVPLNCESRELAKVEM